MQIDDIDRRLLRHLLTEPDLPAAELASRAGITAATCWRRLERMREAGVILGEHALIDWRALGWEVEVSLRFTLDKTEPRAFDEFIAAAREVLAEVPECLTPVALQAGYADAGALVKGLEELMATAGLRAVVDSYIPDRAALPDLIPEMYTPERSDNFLPGVDRARLERILESSSMS